MAEFCRAHIYRCALLIFIGLFSTTGVHAQSNEFVGIDFRLSKEKHALLVVELASNAAAVDIQPMPDGLNISLHETSVVDEKLFVVDVSDFATSVENVEVFREGSNTRLFASTNAAYNYDYRLRDRFLEITVSAKPKDEPEQASILEKEGKLISINFQDIPVRSVLQLIADYNGFNLVVSDSVTGNLTLKVDDVPWQQVLDIILKVKGLDKRVEGNVILVAPKEEFDQREQQDLEQERLAQELGTLESKIVEVKFAKASDIAEMIGGDGEISMLSERGSISIDERTNSLLVRDLPENISVIEDIVESLDIPVKQVQIEARIVTVTEGELEELGVRWGFSSTSGPNSVGATIENNLATVGLYQAGGSGGDSGGEGGGEGGGGGSTSIDDFLAVNLGATNANAASIAFQVAKLGSDTLLDLELSALQTENKAEIISSPRLITTNKKPAYIEQGTEIPYLEASSSGATTVAFRKAVLSLKVTPQITPDNKLVLDLSVTQDRPGKVVKTGNGEALAIETQRIGTQVLVDNGETVVLGGIYQQSVTNTVDKVPLLGDLPLLGALFRRSYENLGKSELLIFITPKVVLQ
ncbi:putative Type IV pilus secretin PilQ [Vibrio nigripulchritudo SO65]|uniref:type IV pilus secretin PilQ n=1 Tax=Vibrio nigripulchritudo TaxID=28173 RepID=UPI0003B1C5DB|nr:type IV pilus secretin PilQ family protein [Vibrio nigripulchritudo]KJY79008.1 fimbrial protein [Vibrio nigripulchritudo]CCN32764.1 putative Type IV pilus secretin PilQ [Vibrio nigripulchritudo AM115]CCN41032.1 putative Type IV pilus secretin PilQ [Vibrio nigripulchritudo FTn2]CCN65149.1 putative Type IV pilus secretin PilQ [Vibrio nigripulchritudo POn4]CCN70352.1 putative Type IV pilus secretin PilQ [Vibrio nigripulchritudo SFn118]